MTITPTQLEYLLAALEEPTWKRAAERVGVSPSAFSQGITEMERRLGLTLFDREGRQRVPNAHALATADHARRILGEIRGLENWAQEVRDGDAGQLTIGMIDTAAVHHFGDALMAYRSRYPEVAVRLIVRPSGELLDLLVAGQADAIVAVSSGRDDPLVKTTPLVTEPLFVYAPPGTAVGEPDSWGPWVTFPPESSTRRLAAGELARIGVDFEVVAESSQPAVLREMVMLGMGWTVLSSVDAERPSVKTCGCSSNRRWSASPPDWMLRRIRS